MTPTRPILTARHYAVLTAAFLFFVLYGSLVPLNTRPLSFDQATELFSKAMARGVRFDYRSDFAANVILFVPLGFLAAGALTVDRRNVLPTLALIPAMGALSAGIEFLQLWFPARNTNISDVAAESIGGAIGVGAWWLVGQSFTVRIRSAWANLGPGDWAPKVLLGYLGFLVIAHGMPFDLTLSPFQIKKKYTNGREIDAEETNTPQIAISPRPVEAGEKTLRNVVFFVPVGVLLAFLPGRRWRGREAGSRVLLVGVAIAGTIEALQLIVLSCSTYASDVLSGAILILAGWLLATRPRPIPQQAWMAALAIWSVLTCLAFWAPFDANPGDFSRRIGEVNWIPFADYYQGNYISAFNSIVNKTVIFVPVGFLLCRAWRLHWASGLIAGAVVSAVVEIGQSAFNLKHGTSLSDVILGAIGGGFGALLASRLADVAQPNHKQVLSTEY